MHYYKRNLGDYAKKAGRLTMLQHGAYTLLIDSCYDREDFPTIDEAIEWTWASTEAEIEAVKFVLSRFFTVNSVGKYVQDRILQELLEYQAKSSKNKQIALEREAKRKDSGTTRTRIVDESSPNHKPITNNHKPIKDNPNGFDLFWDAYGYKTGKPNAIKEWIKLNISDDQVTIGIIVDKAKKDRLTKPDNKYRKHPERWLKGHHWLDELEESTKSSSIDIFAPVRPQ